MHICHIQHNVLSCSTPLFLQPTIKMSSAILNMCDTYEIQGNFRDSSGFRLLGQYDLI